MELSGLDYSLIFGFFAIVLGIGFYVSKTSGKNTSEYFLSGRNMPWWILGVSMYKKGRRKVLQHFLERPQIYYTEKYHDLWEANARKNIQKELTLL